MSDWLAGSPKTIDFFDVRYSTIVQHQGNKPDDAIKLHEVLGELCDSHHFTIFLYLHELSKDYKPEPLAARNLNCKEANGSQVIQVKVDPELFTIYDPPFTPIYSILQSFINKLTEGFTNTEWETKGSHGMMQITIGEIIDFFNSDAANNKLPSGFKRVKPVLFNSKYALGSMLRPLSIRPDDPWGDASEQYRAIPLGSLLATSLKLQYPQFDELLTLLIENGFRIDLHLTNLPQFVNLPPFPFKNGRTL